MKRFLRYSVLGIIGLVILGAILANLGDEQAETTSANNNIKTQPNEISKEQEKKEEMVGIGEELLVGDVVFKVNEVSTAKRIEDEMFYYEPDAEGSIFFLINVSVKNNGKEMINTDSSFFQLVKGEVTYSPTTLITSDDRFFLFEGINPGLTKTGNVVFEVPEKEKDFILNVQTGFWGTEQGQIRLY